MRHPSLNRQLTVAVCLAALALSFPAVRAQDAVANTSVAYETETAAPGESTAHLSDSEVSPIQRRFQYAFRFGSRGVYDDNILLTTSDQIDDFYFTLEGGVTLGWGDIVGSNQNYLRLDYAPSAIIYFEHSDANGLQHVIRLTGQYHFRRLSVVLNQDIELLTGTNLGSFGSTGPNSSPGVRLDSGGITDVNIFTTSGSFAYDLSGKTFLSGGLQHILYDYEDDLIGSETISGNLFINFVYSPKVTIGLGATAGYNWVDAPSPDQTYQQLNGRVTYQATGKVTFNASGGIEFRQFDSEGDGSYVSPVYDLGATYAPFDGTSISLNGTRRIENSAVAAGQDYAKTNINLSLRQRFFQRIYLGIAFGFENSTYFSTVHGVDARREDNYYFVQPGIDVTINGYWTAGAYYLRRENDSNTSFGFEDNQFGIRTSVAF